ncbi:hypothetical protein C0Q70_15120 [Pomacea canaliculata]|uniref:Uncharacterized protein n=1 Tax=Pomacea canaliculata TaxID=400727 RepID=A0A2T7NU13_POMCA|nr:hypothetical protein C0Q70_15120 [Pomacea canaliculata]
MNQRYETCHLWLATARIPTWKRYSLGSTAVTCWQLSGSCACIQRTGDTPAIHLSVDQPLSFLTNDGLQLPPGRRNAHANFYLPGTGYRVAGTHSHDTLFTPSTRHSVAHRAFENWRYLSSPPHRDALLQFDLLSTKSLPSSSRSAMDG